MYHRSVVEVLMPDYFHDPAIHAYAPGSRPDNNRLAACVAETYFARLQVSRGVQLDDSYIPDEHLVCCAIRCFWLKAAIPIAAVSRGVLEQIMSAVEGVCMLRLQAFTRRCDSTDCYFDFHGCHGNITSCTMIQPAVLMLHLCLTPYVIEVLSEIIVGCRLTVRDCFECRMSIKVDLIAVAYRVSEI